MNDEIKEAWENAHYAVCEAFRASGMGPNLPVQYSFTRNADGSLSVDNVKFAIPANGLKSKKENENG